MTKTLAIAAFLLLAGGPAAALAQPAPAVEAQNANAARADAAQTAVQPIGIAQGIAAACRAGATGALATVGWRWLAAANRVGDLMSRLASDRGAAVASMAAEHALVAVAGVAVCLVVAPVAIYFTLADE